MPRIARVVGVGLPHHITQRGNYGSLVFETDSDRQRYLNLVSEYSVKHSLSIIGYCLMPNHVHFLAIPGNENSLARVFNTAHMRYAQWLNRRRRTKGHLWQGRFYSCVLGGSHFLSAARYIERNPVRAGFVASPADWKWSSAGFHAGTEARSRCFDLDALWEFFPEMRRHWTDFIAEYNKEREDEIRSVTRAGRVAGDFGFVAQLERRLGRRLRPLPVGRPVTKQK
jgi:putative transposase